MHDSEVLSAELFQDKTVRLATEIRAEGERGVVEHRITKEYAVPEDLGVVTRESEETEIRQSDLDSEKEHSESITDGDATTVVE